MREGVELFNQQMYWECHESLEDVWMEDKGDLARNVYWAVIQVVLASDCTSRKTYRGNEYLVGKNYFFGKMHSSNATGTKKGARGYIPIVI